MWKTNVERGLWWEGEEVYMKVGEGRRENNGIEGMGKGGGRKWRDEGDQQEASGGKEINILWKRYNEI